MKASELDHAAVVTDLKNYVFIYIMWKAGCVHYGKKVNWLTAMFCLETFVLELMQMFLLHVPLIVPKHFYRPSTPLYGKSIP